MVVGTQDEIKEKTHSYLRVLFSELYATGDIDEDTMEIVADNIAFQALSDESVKTRKMTQDEAITWCLQNILHEALDTWLSVDNADEPIQGGQEHGENDSRSNPGEGLEVGTDSAESPETIPPAT